MNRRDFLMRSTAAAATATLSNAPLIAGVTAEEPRISLLVVDTDRASVPIDKRTVAARLDGTLWERLIESVPDDLKRPLVASIQEAAPSNEAIKNAVQNQVAVPGAEVYRGDHLRVA